ncbi:hypothetical protein PG985_003735 [Apiospora marii]|uniref:uncharacterized protein n=1 Tax=Apiospora marii TaxID=335849 RepID=UPI00312ECCDD
MVPKALHFDRKNPESFNSRLKAENGGSSQPVPTDSRSSVSDGHADKLGADGEGSDLDYIADMDWESPPSSAIPTSHADTALNPQPVYVEGNLGLPQSPKPLLKLKDPSPLPNKAEV